MAIIGWHVAIHIHWETRHCAMYETNLRNFCSKKSQEEWKFCGLCNLGNFSWEKKNHFSLPKWKASQQISTNLWCMIVSNSYQCLSFYYLQVKGLHLNEAVIITIVISCCDRTELLDMRRSPDILSILKKLSNSL